MGVLQNMGHKIPPGQLSFQNKRIPMTRSFSMVLILLGLFVVGSAVSWHYHTLEEKNKDLLTLAVSLDVRKSEALQEDILFFSEDLEKEIKESHYSKYQPLVTVLQTVRESIESYLEGIEAQKNSTDLIEFTEVQLAELIAAQSEVVRTNAQSFDLREEWADREVAKLAEIADAKKFLSVRNLTEADDPLDYAFLKSMVAEYYLLSCRELILRANFLIKRPCFVFENYFPALLSDRTTSKSGEQIDVKLAVGVYSVNQTPENVSFIINGETYHPGYDGILNHSFIAKGKGEQQFRVDLEVRNPLTGEVRRSQMNHSYLVQ